MMISRRSGDSDHAWLQAAASLEWATPPAGASDHPWSDRLRAGSLNLTASLLDRHVRAGRGEVTALRVRAVTGAGPLDCSYAELLDHTEGFTGVLAGRAITMGDRVLIYGGPTLETYVTVLACLRLGATWTYVSGESDPIGLASRIAAFWPRAVVVTAADAPVAGMASRRQVLSRALELAGHEPELVVAADRSAEPINADELDWWTATTDSAREGSPRPALTGSHPAWLAYSAGTEREPAGFVRRLGPYAAGLQWTIEEVLGLTPRTMVLTDSPLGSAPGDVAFLGALLVGATFMPFDDDSGHAPALGIHDDVATSFVAILGSRRAQRIIRERVTVPGRIFTWGESTMVAGGRPAPPGSPETALYWQTELGFPLLLDERTAHPDAAPGLLVDASWSSGNYGELKAVCLPPVEAFAAVDSDGRLGVEQLGGTGADHHTGDVAQLVDGGAAVVGRLRDLAAHPAADVDPVDVANIVGLERRIRKVDGVSDVAVVHRPVGAPGYQAFVEFRGDVDRAPALEAVRQEVESMHLPVDVVGTTALPRTRQGTILRRTLRDLLVGQNIPIPTALDNLAALDDIRTALSGRAAGMDLLASGEARAQLREELS